MKITREELAERLDRIQAHPDLPEQHRPSIAIWTNDDCATLHKATPEQLNKLIASLVKENLWALGDTDARPATVDAAAAQADGLAGISDEPEEWALQAQVMVTFAYAQTLRHASSNRTMSLSALADTINQQKPVAQETVDKLAKQHASGKALNNAIKVLGPVLHFAHFIDGAHTRNTQNIEADSGPVFDYDFRSGDRVRRADAEAAAKAKGVAALFWDTYSSGIEEGDDGMTFRMLMPCAEPLAVDLHHGAHFAAAEFLGIKAPTPLPATQPFFYTPRIGCASNALAILGKPIDQLIDLHGLEPDTESAIIPTTSGSGRNIDPLDFEVFNDDKRALYLRCLPLIEPWSEDRGHWIGVIGAGLRGWAITPEILKKPALQTDEQKALLIELDSWSKNENPPPGAERKYTKGCVVREGAKLFNGAKLAGLHAIVQKAHTAAPEGLEIALTDAPELLALAMRVLGHRPSAAADFTGEMGGRDGAADEEAHRAVINAPDPFPGMHSTLTAAILAASYIPQPNLASLCALIALAALSGGSTYTDGTRCNLFGALLSESSSGKEKPVECAQAAVIEGNVPVLSTPASGEALEDALPTGPVLMIMREAAHIFRVMSGDNAAPHAVSLARMILDLFSAGERDKYLKRRKAGQREEDRVAVANPALSVLLASTPGKLGEALSTDNIGDGLLGRLLYAEGDPGAERQRQPVKFKVPAELGFVEDWIVNLTMSEAADELLWQMTLGFDAERKVLLKRGDRATAALLGRRAEKIKRIAGILAVPAGGTVTAEMVAWAGKFCEASDAVLLSFTDEHLDKSKDIRDTDKVLAAARGILAGTVKTSRSYYSPVIRAGYIPRALCLKASHLSKAKFDLAVLHLIDIDALALGTYEGKQVFSLGT